MCRAFATLFQSRITIWFILFINFQPILAAEPPPVLVETWGEKVLQQTTFVFEDDAEVAVFPIDQTIYVFDDGNNRLQHFDGEGNLLDTWQDVTPIVGEPLPTDIEAIAFNANGHFYISTEDWVYIYHPGGTLLNDWPIDNQGDHRLVVDSQNHLYVSYTSTNIIKKYDENGVLLVEWGNTVTPDQFNGVGQLAINQNDTVYVVDSGNHQIQLFDNIGNPIKVFGSQGTESGQFDFPVGIAVSGYDAQNNVYVSDSSGRIQKFTAEGEWLSTWGNTPSLGTMFAYPQAVAANDMEHVYVLDRDQNRAYQFIPDDSTNTMQLIEINKQGDNTASSKVTVSSPSQTELCDLNCPFSLEVPTGTTLTVEASFTSDLEFVGWEGDCQGQPATFSFTVEQPLTCTAVFAEVIQPQLEMRIAGAGSVEAVEANVEAFCQTGVCQKNYLQGSELTLTAKPAADFSFAGWSLDCQGQPNPLTFQIEEATRCAAIFVPYLHTVAGTGKAGFAGDGSYANQARLNQPHGLVFDSQNNLWLADRQNHVIRRIEAKTGLITTVAGSGIAGYSGDNQSAHLAQLNAPTDLTIDELNNIFIADTGNHVIRKISPDGVISTVAGIPGQSGFDPNNTSPRQTPLHAPQGLDYANGALWIADTENHVIRKLSNGQLNVMAGNGQPGYQGDNGPARQANLQRPHDVLVSEQGIFIADTFNHAIRLLTTDGVITTLSGKNRSGNSPLAIPRKQALFNLPTQLAQDHQDRLYIVDRYNHTLRMLQEGFIYTLLGGGNLVEEDGLPAHLVKLTAPTGIAVNAQNAIYNAIYLADTGAHRIRKTGQPINFDDNLSTSPDSQLRFSPNLNTILQVVETVEDEQGFYTELRIELVGDNEVTLQAAELAGDHPQDFVILTPNFPTTLTPDAPMTTITPACYPTEEGLRTAQLVLTSTDDNAFRVAYRLECAAEASFFSHPQPGDLVQVAETEIFSRGKTPLELFKIGQGEITIIGGELIGEQADVFELENVQFPLLLTDELPAHRMVISCQPSSVQEYAATLSLFTSDPLHEVVEYQLWCEGLPFSNWLTLETKGKGFFHNCGRSCQLPYEEGEWAEVRAEPYPGWEFAGWSGDCDRENWLLMDRDKRCVAHFLPTDGSAHDVPPPEHDADAETEAPPPPPANGQVSGTSRNDNGTAQNVHVAPRGSLTGGQLQGENTNEGLVSNVHLAPDAKLDGGKISGSNVNDGTVCNATVTRYSELQGGQLCGQIKNEGTLKDVKIQAGSELQGEGKLEGGIVNEGRICDDVQLGKGSKVVGGSLGCRLEGEKEEPAVIGKATIEAGTELENVCLTHTVQVADNVKLGSNVLRFPPTDNPGLEDYCIVPANVASFDASQVQGTEDEAFQTFEKIHVKKLPPESLTAVTPDKMKQFKRQALEGLQVEQFNQLPKDALGGLTRENMGGLPPTVIKTFEIDHLNALPPEEFKNMSKGGVPKMVTNVDPEKIKPEDLQTLIGEGWTLDPQTGDLTAPPGAQLALRALPPPANLPENVALPDYIFDLNSTLAVGGNGSKPPVLTRLNQVRPGVKFEQQEDGIVIVNRDNKRYTYLVDTEKVQQLAEDAETTLEEDEIGQLVVTTEDKQQLTLKPAPKSMTELLGILGSNAEALLTEDGQTLMTFTHPGQGKVTLVSTFAAELGESSGEEPGIYIDFSDSRRGTRADSQATVVFTDGTSQNLWFSVLYPDTFMSSVLSTLGVESIVMNADSTFTVIFSGLTYYLEPTADTEYSSLASGQVVSPSIEMAGANYLIYKVQTGEDLVSQGIFINTY